MYSTRMSNNLNRWKQELKGISMRTKYSEAVKASKKSWSIGKVDATGDQFRLKQALLRGRGITGVIEVTLSPKQKS